MLVNSASLWILLRERHIQSWFWTKRFMNESVSFAMHFYLSVFPNVTTVNPLNKLS
jgi:hypothetical protein